MNTLRLRGPDVPPDGKTFETGVCSLLLKKMGKERLKYWRTSNKQEIDFIVMGEMGDRLMGYEVKKRYPGEPSAFSYFKSQYPGSGLKVVALEGRAQTGKPREFIYPWEI